MSYRERASYDVGQGRVSIGDTCLYAGELPCTVVDILQDGDVSVELRDGKIIHTKWRYVSPWKE